MARRVFFSFHYQNDIWRASQVRNSWVTQDREVAGFWDAARWEAVKRGGDQAIKRWIEAQLSGTSVTVVLIGTETASRTYVNYEIKRSHELGKGLMGVWIHNMQDQSRRTCAQGPNPFDGFWVGDEWNRKYLSQVYSVYDWVRENGYSNFARWVDAAAKAAGR